MQREKLGTWLFSIIGVTPLIFGWATPELDEGKLVIN